MQRKTFRVRGLFEYIIALVIILDCNSVWNNFRHTRTWFQYVLLIMLYLSVFCCLIAVGKLKTKKLYEALIFLFLIVAYFGIFIFMNSNSIITSVINMLLAVCALAIYFYFCVEDGESIGLMLKFRDIMAVIAVVSLFFWLVGPITKILQPTAVYYTNWSGINNESQVFSYFDIFYSWQNISFFGVLYIARNTAIFNEAPMSSLCFGLALMIDMLYQKSPSRWRRIGLMVAIITTFSTGGYILLAILCIYEFVRNRPKQRLLYFVKVLGIPIGFVTMIIIGLTLIEEKLESFSGMARLDDYISGFNAWLQNPIFGDGFGSLEAMTKARPIWRRSAGGFNSGIMAILVQCGLYGIVVYLFVFIRSIYKGIKTEKMDLTVFSILYVYLLLITVVPYNYITIMVLLFISFSIINQKKLPRFKH